MRLSISRILEASCFCPGGRSIVSSAYKGINLWEARRSMGWIGFDKNPITSDQ